MTSVRPSRSSSCAMECLEGRMLLSMTWEGNWTIKGIGYQAEQSSPSGTLARQARTMSGAITSLGGNQFQLTIAATPGVEAFQATLTMSADGNSLSMNSVASGGSDQYLRLSKLGDNVVSVFESNIEFDSADRNNIRAAEGFGGMATRSGTPTSFGTFSFAGTRTFNIANVETTKTAGGAMSSAISSQTGKVTITAQSDGTYKLLTPDGKTQIFKRDTVASRLVRTENSQETSGSKNYIKRGTTIMLGPDGRLLFINGYGAYNSSRTARDRASTLLGLGHVVYASFDAGSSGAVNFAPVLSTSRTLRMNTINEDDRTNSGTAIKDLIASSGINSITDQNTSGKEGVAIIARNATIGTWQYSTDGGATWLNVPTVSNSAALLLASDAGGQNRIRLVPKRNYNGSTAAALTLRAWDQSRGISGRQLSAAATGGATPFSTATLTASLRVNAVNDAPVLGGMPIATAPRFIEGGTPVYLMPSVTVSDIDSANMAGATVRFSGYYAGSQDQLLFKNTSAITGSYDVNTGTLTLTGTASKAAYQAALRSIRYRNPSQNPQTDARTISATVRDASATSNARTQTLQVVGVNDAPTVASGNITIQGATLGQPLALDFNQLATAINQASPYSDVDNATDTLGFRLTAVSGTLSKGGVAGSTVVMLPADTNVTWTPTATGTIKAFTLRIWDGALASAGVINVYVEVA